MSKKPKTLPQRDIFSEAMAMQARFAATATRFNTRMIEQAAAVNFEMFDFMNQRLGQDLAATEALGHCKSIESAFETLGDFQKKALEDYTCEGAKLQAQTTHISDAISEEVAEDVEALAREVRPKNARRDAA